MRIILKIIAAPAVLALTLIVAVLNFSVSLASWVLGILSLVLIRILAICPPVYAPLQVHSQGDLMRNFFRYPCFFRIPAFSGIPCRPAVPKAASCRTGRIRSAGI